VPQRRRLHHQDVVRVEIDRGADSQVGPAVGAEEEGEAEVPGGAPRRRRNGCR